MAAELPITKNPAAQYVPWTVGLMMYLASLSALLFLLGFHFFGSWRDDFSNHITLEIPTYTLFENSLSPQDTETLLKEILSFVQNTPGIDQASVLSPDQAQELLSLWLGNQDTTLKNLPLPILIEIKKTPKASLDLPSLEASLKRIAPSLCLLNHETHFSKIFVLGFSLEIFLLALMGAFFVTAFLTLSFATRTSLLIHRNIIDILSLLGASDDVIAQEFQFHARAMAIRGACIAYGLLGGTSLLAVLLFKEHTAFSFPFFFLNHFSWDILLGFLTPLIMGVFMVFSARLSIERLLHQLNKV